MSSQAEEFRRVNDTGFHRWYPVMVIVASIGISFGVQQRTLTEITQNIVDMQKEIRSARDESIEARGERVRLSEKIAEQSITADIVANLAKAVGAVERGMEDATRRDENQWAIVRTSEANIEILGDAVRMLGQPVTLQKARPR